jgi:eukaryotic-like serine/threonine-protein kinase
MGDSDGEQGTGPGSGRGPKSGSATPAEAVAEAVDHASTATEPTELQKQSPRAPAAGLASAQTEVSPTNESAGASSTVDPNLVGLVLAGRYELTRQIGVGGMGAVYEATHRLIGKRVAVKVLLEKYAAKDQVVARLEQEARLASSIGHENIVDITDFGATAEGRRFVVMEYLEGESLGALLRREGPQPAERIVNICLQVASALGAAHKCGVIHRDVKPENVFLTRRAERDFVKVVDFGISKAMREPGGEESPRLTQTGMVLGTPLYMSPEQARGDDELDPRVDVYALGVIMYELATGDVPFRGANYLNIISQVLSATPTPPREARPDLAISAELESIIMTAIAKDRDQRYQSMADVAADLQALREGSPVSATASAHWRPNRLARRPLGRLVLWSAGVMVLAGAVVAAVVELMTEDPRPAPAVAAGPEPEPLPELPAATAQQPLADRPKPDLVAIRLTSEPSGAAVWADEGRRLICKATPCVWDAIKKDQEVRLVFELEGFDDAEIAINPLTSGPEQTIRLARATNKSPRRRLRPSTQVSPSPKPPSGQEDDTVGGELMGNPVRRKQRVSADGAED